ncbi:hypothetical protein [Pandoraea sp. XY-2]
MNALTDLQAPRRSLSELEQRDNFSARHIGPDTPNNRRCSPSWATRRVPR